MSDTSEDKRTEVTQLARQLQAMGPDEFPYGYYVHLAKVQIEEQNKHP